MNLGQFISILAGAFIVVGTLMFLLFLSGFWDKNSGENIEKSYPEFFVETSVTPS